jgi:hypothetical protein
LLALEAFVTNLELANSQMEMNNLSRALDEAALRLAWYIGVHGPIPDGDVIMLQAVATGLREDREAKQLLDEARNIKEYLLEIAAR